MLLMTLVTIVIYFIGIRIDNRSKEISQKQLEILENDRIAQFIIEQDIDEKKLEMGESHLFTVKNIGGSITDGLLFPIYYYLIRYDNLTFAIEFDYYEHLELPISYDEKNKEFRGRYIDNKKFIDSITDNLKVNTIICRSYINIWYTDYKNEQHFSYYSPGITGMNLINEKEILDEYDVIITVQENQSVERICNIIKEKSKIKENN